VLTPEPLMLSFFLAYGDPNFFTIFFHLMSDFISLAVRNQSNVVLLLAIISFSISFGS
jgi:hypothetical protein